MRRILALALVGCVSPTVEVPSEPVPAVCAQQALALPPIAQLDVAPTPLGAAMIWASGGAVMTQRFDADARPIGEMTTAWAGTYERASVATIGDQVIVGAVSGDLTWMVSAPLGLPPYRELALLGGRVGASPIVIAGGQRVAASVSYGGMQVNAFDSRWSPQTSLHAVLTGAARDVAATSIGAEAIVVWPSGTSCYVARLFDAAHGESRATPGRCDAPRLAATDHDVGLVFERDGGVYLARGAASDLLPQSATWLGSGRAPRIAADGDRYWVSYLDTSGALVAGLADQLVTLAPADTHELVVLGGIPRVFAAGPAGLTVSSLCD